MRPIFRLQNDLIIFIYFSVGFSVESYPRHRTNSALAQTTTDRIKITEQVTFDARVQAAGLRVAVIVGGACVVSL